MRKVLDSLAIKAEAMWPAIKYKSGGSRAQSAAKMVADGRVLLLGNGLYRVGDKHTASFADNHCTCLDRAPIDRKHGKLCKHRLAIMFTLSKALNDRNGWLADRVAEVAAMATNGFFELVFESNYDRPHIKRLIGYSLNGSTTTRFKDSGDVTVEQLKGAIAGLGVGLMGMPQKLSGWEYAFRFSESGKANLTEATWAHKAVTPQMIERAKWQLGEAEAARLRAQLRVA